MNKDKMKGFLAGVVIMTMVFGMSLTAFGTTGSQWIEATFNNIKIFVDQKQVTPKDANGNTVEPFIYNGTTYLPVRAVSQALGKEVSWNNTTKSVYIGTQPAAVTDPNQNAEEALSKYMSTNKDMINGIFAEVAADDDMTMEVSFSGKTIILTMSAMSGETLSSYEVSLLKMALDQSWGDVEPEFAELLEIVREEAGNSQIDMRIDVYLGNELVLTKTIK